MKFALRVGRVVVWMLASAWCESAFAEMAALDWEAAFPVESAAADVYLDAHFVGSDGASHRLQLWRHGTQYLRRRTDETLDLYLHRTGEKDDYSYRLIDHRRRVSMDVNRNQLYRIGVFSDWFGLAHILDRPKSAFVVRAAAPSPKEKPANRLKDKTGCVWRLLVRGGEEAHDQVRICWSAAWGVPMSIRVRGANGEWIEQLSVDRVESLSSVGGLAMPVVPAGYASFDVGSEIDPKEGD